MEAVLCMNVLIEPHLFEKWRNRMFRKYNILSTICKSKQSVCIEPRLIENCLLFVDKLYHCHYIHACAVGGDPTLVSVCGQ